MTLKQSVQNILLFVSFGMASAAVVADSAEKQMTIQWDEGNAEIRDTLQTDGVFQDGIDFINDTFLFERPVNLIIGAEDGPLYDPQQDIIQIPYEFYTQVVTLFAEVEPEDKDLQHQYAIDTMLHTLFHEYGHAVIEQFDLPIVGKEEDAVDALASVLLIEYYENGAEMAINAAELFALESEDRGSLQEEDFWDEHSLDEQRYYSTLCHVVGSDPRTYRELAESAGFSIERAESCEFEYQQLVADWDTLLEPVRR